MKGRDVESERASEEREREREREGGRDGGKGVDRMLSHSKQEILSYLTDWLKETVKINFHLFHERWDCLSRNTQIYSSGPGPFLPALNLPFTRCYTMSKISRIGLRFEPTTYQK